MRDFTQTLFTRRVTPGLAWRPTTSFRANIVIHDYFWRVQVSAGDVAGPMSEVFTFNWVGISMARPPSCRPIRSLETVHPRLIVARALNTGTVRTMIYSFRGFDDAFLRSDACAWMSATTIGAAARPLRQTLIWRRHERTTGARERTTRAPTSLVRIRRRQCS